LLDELSRGALRNSNEKKQRFAIMKCKASAETNKKPADTMLASCFGPLGKPPTGVWPTFG
jgi:hypothetical protein